MSNQRPNGIRDQHLDYLDELRESGETNMWSSPSYLTDVFNLSEKNARIIFQYWKNTFGDDAR